MAAELARGLTTEPISVAGDERGLAMMKMNHRFRVWVKIAAEICGDYADRIWIACFVFISDDYAA